MLFDRTCPDYIKYIDAKALIGSKFRSPIQFKFYLTQTIWIITHIARSGRRFMGNDPVIARLTHTAPLALFCEIRLKRRGSEVGPRKKPSIIMKSP